MSNPFITLRHYSVQKGGVLFVFPPVLKDNLMSTEKRLGNKSFVSKQRRQIMTLLLSKFCEQKQSLFKINQEQFFLYSRDRKINSSILIGAIRKQSASQYIVRLRHSRTDRGNGSWQSGNVTPNLSPLSAAIHKTFIPYQQKFYHQSSEFITSCMFQPESIAV